MNNDNNNQDNMNNMQNNFGVLPGIEPEPNNNVDNNGFILPGTMENQNVNQPVTNNMEANQNSIQDVANQMGNNAYQALNQDMNFNPYNNMNFQNQNQDINGQTGFDNPYQNPEMNFNPYNTNNQFTDPNMMNNIGNEPYQNITQETNYNGINNDMQDPMPYNGNDINGMNNDSYQNNSGFDNGDLTEEFTRAWMGEALYQKSQTKRFNWCAAIFGPAYLLFRKMYLLGAVTTLFEIAVIIAGTVLATKVPAAGIAIQILLIVGFFVGLGLGFYGLYKNFIKGKLSKYSRETNDSNQLINIAGQKGGKSIIGVVIQIIATTAITTLVFSLLLSSGTIFLSNNSDKINTNTTDNNTTTEPENNNTSEYMFDTDYSLMYNMNEWYLDETANALTKGNYKLAYTTKFTSQQCGFDLSSADGRAGLLKYLTDSFTAQIAQTDMQFDTGNSNFVPQNDVYYNYMDFTTANMIQRYYFVVIPQDNIAMQFTLSINDTSVDSTTNISIIDMLTSITKNENNQLNMNGLSGANNEIDTTNENVSNTGLSTEQGTSTGNTTSTTTGTTSNNQNVSAEQTTTGTTANQNVSTTQGTTQTTQPTQQQTTQTTIQESNTTSLSQFLQ